jgi:hypothetical protein
MRRLNLELSDDAYETLEMLRKRMDKASKAEVLRSAVALLQLATSEKVKGKKLAILNGDEEVDARIEII